MSVFLVAYLLCFFILVLIDCFWLLSTIDLVYRKNIGHLMATNAVLTPAIFFYFLYSLGVTIFVIMPAVQYSQKSLAEVFLYGALFGLVAYGTYDLTNHAVLREWPLVITIVDMLWGAFMTGTMSLLTVYILRFLR